VPFLRFSRDRRGYESTYLLQPARRRPGEDQPRLLYWFRTPPHVKVGRAAFDEDAIRLLEQAHPELEFDWDRILATRPPAAPEPEDSRQRRPERRVRDLRRAEPRPARPAPRSGPQAGPESAPMPPAQALPAGAASVRLPGSDAPLEAAAEAPPAILAPAAPPPPPPPARRFVRVFDTVPAEDHHATEIAVVERVLGAEQLTILRARYAEILARIAARGGDPARLEALRERAERVNPDAWVTDADVAAGMAAVEGTLAELHQLVGRRRRRRRRRHEGGSSAPTAGESAAAAPDAAIPEDDVGEDEDDQGE
jgi:hypothetical protein